MWVPDPDPVFGDLALPGPDPDPTSLPGGYPKGQKRAYFKAKTCKISQFSFSQKIENIFYIFFKSEAFLNSWLT